MAANGAGPSTFHYLSNAKDVHFHGPTSFNTTAGDFVLYPQSFTPAGEQDLGSLLPHILDATHSPAWKVCTRGTRLGVIQKITAWGVSPIGPNSHVLFLTGCIGSGKSTVSQTVSGDFQREGRLGGCFFFSRDSTVEQGMVLSNFVGGTLALQLANAFPQTELFIRNAIRPQSRVFRQTRVDEQLHSLVLLPFKNAWDHGAFPRQFRPIIFVIDGLDACQLIHQQQFVDAILEFFDRNPFIPLRFLIAACTKPGSVCALPKETPICEDLGDYESDNDIYTFLEVSLSPRVLKRHRVVQSYMKQSNSPAWPGPQNLRALSCHAKGSFRLASEMVRYILSPSNDGSTPIDRLPRALEMDSSLDAHYLEILSQYQHHPNFFDVVSTMTMTTTPLSITSLGELLDLETYRVTSVLENLRSILRVPESDDEPVTFYHDSLRNFLRDPERSAGLYVSPANYLVLSYRCFLRNLHRGPRSETTSGRRSPAAADSRTNCTVYWRSFLEGCKHNLADEIWRFSSVPRPVRGLRPSRHAFLSTLFSWEIFHQGHSSPTPLLSYFFMNWAKQLRRAIEEGPRSIIANWFNLRIRQVIPCELTYGTRCIELSEDAFRAFQSDVQSAANLVAEQLSGALNCLQESRQERAPWAVVDDSGNHSLSPAMMLAALASAKYHSPVGRNECSVVLGINAEQISRGELYGGDESEGDEDEDAEMEDIQGFLESQPYHSACVNFDIWARAADVQ